MTKNGALMNVESYSGSPINQRIGTESRKMLSLNIITLPPLPPPCEGGESCWSEPNSSLSSSLTRTRRATVRRTITPIVLVLLSIAPLRADDWPQWGGPQRDIVWREKGIVKT